MLFHIFIQLKDPLKNPTFGNTLLSSFLLKTPFEPIYKLAKFLVSSNELSDASAILFPSKYISIMDDDFWHKIWCCSGWLEEPVRLLLIVIVFFPSDLAKYKDWLCM